MARRGGKGGGGSRFVLFLILPASRALVLTSIPPHYNNPCPLAPPCTHTHCTLHTSIDPRTLRRGNWGKR